MNQITKERILESWIMVEHLSEGDIKKDDKNLFGFDDLKDGDYYSLFMNKIDEKKIRKYQKSGIVLYLDLFEFKTVVDFLRQEYNLKPPAEEIRYGYKFGLALYFDKDLNFRQKMTFFTVGGYIRYFKKVPQAEQFHEYEEDLKTNLCRIFEIEEDDDDKESSEDNAKEQSPIVPEKFNSAIEKVLNLHFPKAELQNCRFQLLTNFETEATNLHSFFIDDLERAKKISTDNLDKYLLGITGRRINLDSKKDSVNFEPSIFEDILQPRNYPSGRFPSKTEYALSFMQQVAVNLSLGYDTGQIRSVNGPPGTGKTTLLKDIFAELVVRQAYDICKLEKKTIVGTEETRYFEKASIGVLPDQIAENGIVVASSNNGAVQNIVNELPLIKDIDGGLIHELREADYFGEISNSSISLTKDKDKKNTLVITPKDEKLFWGLFSLEGGKSDNVSGIMNNIKAILDYLVEDYEDDDAIYEKFLDQYQEIQDLKKQAQRYADSYKQSLADKIKYEKTQKEYSSEKAEREKRLEYLSEQININSKDYSAEAEKLKAILQDYQTKETENAKYKEEMSRYNQMLSAQKPGLFAKRQIKDQYLQNVSEALSKLESAIDTQHRYQQQIAEVKTQIHAFVEKEKAERDNLELEKKRLFDWADKADAELQMLHDRAEQIDKQIESNNIKPINMNNSYDDLQESNPWFNEDYRIAQSKLFITALKVRKQFLYENQKNLKAAINIWQNQRKHIENKALIEIAWSWFNMAIPVISSRQGISETRQI